MMKVKLECRAFGEKSGAIVEVGQPYGTKGEAKITKNDLDSLVKNGLAKIVNPKEVSSAKEIKAELAKAQAEIESLKAENEQLKEGGGSAEEVEALKAEIESLKAEINELDETAKAADLKAKVESLKGAING